MRPISVRAGAGDHRGPNPRRTRRPSAGTAAPSGEQDDVAGHELGGRHLARRAATQHAHARRQVGREGGDGVLRVLFLPGREPGVEYDDHPDRDREGGRPGYERQPGARSQQQGQRVHELAGQGPGPRRPGAHGQGFGPCTCSRRAASRASSPSRPERSSC